MELQSFESLLERVQPCGAMMRAPGNIFTMDPRLVHFARFTAGLRQYECSPRFRTFSGLAVLGYINRITGSSGERSWCPIRGTSF